MHDVFDNTYTNPSVSKLLAAENEIVNQPDNPVSENQSQNANPNNQSDNPASTPSPIVTKTKGFADFLTNDECYLQLEIDGTNLPFEGWTQYFLNINNDIYQLASSTIDNANKLYFAKDFSKQDMKRIIQSTNGTGIYYTKENEPWDQKTLLTTVSVDKMVVKDKPTLSFKPGVDIRQLGSINKTNFEQFVTVDYHRFVDANDYQFFAVEGNPQTGTVSMKLALCPEFQFEDHSNYITISAQLNSYDWTKNTGCLNYLNNFTNNVNPYAMMAGWKMNLSETEYEPTEPLKNPSQRDPNPSKTLWVPSAQIKHIFYPSLKNQQPTSDLKIIDQALQNQDMNLKFNLKVLSQLTPENFVMMMHNNNPFDFLTDDIGGFDKPETVKATLESLAGLGIQLPAQSKVSKIAFDFTNSSSENPNAFIGISIYADQTIYNLEMQLSYLAIDEA